MSDKCGSLPVLFLDAETVHANLDFADCIQLMDGAMRQVSLGQAELPLRHGMPLPGGGKALGMMPGYLAGSDSRPALFGIKLVSLFADNPAAGLPSHLGLYILYEARHGQPLAILDADAITSIRTAAATAMATGVLARKDSRRLTILGTGEQARAHARALSQNQSLQQISFWGRDREKAGLLAQSMQQELTVSCQAVGDVREAVALADIVCTVTASREPILHGDWLPEGVHLNLVGASFPEAREVDTSAVQRGRYFVDFRHSALNQAGELIHAMKQDELDETHIAGEIGEVLLGQVHGRLNDHQRTIYKSLGVAAQDIPAAWHVFQKAKSNGAGQSVTL